MLFQGKPVAGSEVVIFDPAATETEAKTDDAGRVQLAAAKPGLYSIRAKWVVDGSRASKATRNIRKSITTGRSPSACSD